MFKNYFIGKIINNIKSGAAKAGYKIYAAEKTSKEKIENKSDHLCTENKKNSNKFKVDIDDIEIQEISGNQDSNSEYDVEKYIAKNKCMRRKKDSIILDGCLFDLDCSSDIDSSTFNKLSDRFSQLNIIYDDTDNILNSSNSNVSESILSIVEDLELTIEKQRTKLDFEFMNDEVTKILTYDTNRCISKENIAILVPICSLLLYYNFDLDFDTL